MNVIETPLPGVLVFEPKVFGDPRGYFLELWNLERYPGAGVPRPMVQSNLSRSARGVLRGLHFQNPEPQGKLVMALEGEVFDVAVDIRPDSPTYGQWYGATLKAETHNQIFVPEGYAHGFLVTSETALVCYFCTHYYRPQCEHSLLWNDPEIGIAWPLGVDEVKVSAKDAAAATLKDFDPAKLPRLQD